MLLVRSSFRRSEFSTPEDKMIYHTEESRGGLTAAQFERNVAGATDAIWTTIGAFFQEAFRAAHVMHGPGNRRGTR